MNDLVNDPDQAPLRPLPLSQLNYIDNLRDNNEIIEVDENGNSNVYDG